MGNPGRSRRRKRVTGGKRGNGEKNFVVNLIFRLTSRPMHPLLRFEICEQLLFRLNLQAC